MDLTGYIRNAQDAFSRVNRSVPEYALVVQGRFHAFALARSLIALEMPVRIITNYPAFMAERFGVSRKHVIGCAPLGLLHRYAHRWDLPQRFDAVNRFLHVSFSKWAARQVVTIKPELVHAFSGVAANIYDALDRAKIDSLKILARGSAHIREQHRDLHRESIRAGCPDIDMPGTWMIRREMDEYRRSDHILTLSSYARDSFLHRGYSLEKILMLELGSNVKQFRPEREVVDRRIERLRSGKKMTVLYTGNVSLQKGIIDLIETARALGDKIHFRVVGNIVADAASRVEAARDVIEFLPRVPEHELPGIYADADAYVFPTLHDGYAAVLAQARAGCLPIVATDHCAAPDMIVNGENGWIVPTRRADRLIDRLQTLDQDREATINMVENLWQRCDTRDWSDVGRDFIVLAARAFRRREELRQR